MPESMHRVDTIGLFNSSIDKASTFYERLKGKLTVDQAIAAEYALTNAHRREVVFQANARELAHLARLRQDSHAQWDIRNISDQMIELARQACPAVTMFACGKDQYEEHHAKIYKTGETKRPAQPDDSRTES